MRIPRKLWNAPVAKKVQEPTPEKPVIKFEEQEKNQAPKKKTQAKKKA